MLKSFASSKPDVARQDRAVRIADALKDPSLEIRMQFLGAVLPMFNNFEKLFQSSDVMITVLHAEMTELLKNLLVQYVRPEKLENVTTVRQLLAVDYESLTNQVCDDELPIGNSTRKTIKEYKLSHGDKKRFFLDVRKFLTVATKKLIHYLPLENRVLQDLQCIGPSAQKLPESSYRSVIVRFCHKNRYVYMLFLT